MLGGFQAPEDRWWEVGGEDSCESECDQVFQQNVAYS